MKTIQRYMGIVYQNLPDGKVRYDLYMTDAWGTEEEVFKELEEAQDEILELFEHNECCAYERATREESEQLFANMLNELRAFRLRFPKQEIDDNFDDISVRIRSVTVHLS
jgi:hypothetical protein